MRVTVKYAANVKAGDLFAGTVETTAPTRPVQPCAHAVTVVAVEILTDDNRPRWKGVRLDFEHGLWSKVFNPADQIMTIES